MKCQGSDPDRTHPRWGSSTVRSPWETDEVGSVRRPAVADAPRYASGSSKESESETGSDHFSSLLLQCSTKIKQEDSYLFVLECRWHDPSSSTWHFKISVGPSGKRHESVGKSTGSKHGEHSSYDSSHPDEIPQRWNYLYNNLLLATSLSHEVKI